MTRKPTAVTWTVPGCPGEPDSYDILILDAATRQGLACARSLGRAGLRVATGECSPDCGPSRPALAFHSRYSSRSVVFPAITADGADFGVAIVEFVRKHPTRVVLPLGDGTIAALMPRRDELAALGCVLALAPSPALMIANDKDRTLAAARSLGIDYPKTMRIDNLDDISSVVAEFYFPFVLKPTSSRTGQSTGRLFPVEVIDKTEATEAAERILASGADLLAQQFASGRREGVALFIIDGEILASCTHVEYRTNPPLGGASVMRQSIPPQQDTYSAAVRLATTIGIQGPCLVEFRRNADNRPLLMEINARLGGATEHAVRSGVDFPLMIWQWAANLPINRIESYRTGVRTRWLRGDMSWFLANYGRAGRPDSVSRGRAFNIFATEFARTRYYDCFDLHDLGPVLAELKIMTTATRRSVSEARSRKKGLEAYQDVDARTNERRFPVPI